MKDLVRWKEGPLEKGLKSSLSGDLDPGGVADPGGPGLVAAVQPAHADGDPAPRPRLRLGFQVAMDPYEKSNGGSIWRLGALFLFFTPFLRRGIRIPVDGCEIRFAPRHESMVETMICWHLRGGGIVRNQGFLGGAKWISSTHSSRLVFGF